MEVVFKKEEFTTMNGFPTVIQNIDHNSLSVSTHGLHSPRPRCSETKLLQDIITNVPSRVPMYISKVYYSLCLLTVLAFHEVRYTEFRLNKI